MTLTGHQTAALTAEEVMDNMSNREQSMYISGMVEGLAFARWLADGRNDAGMQCILDWYYQSDQRALLNTQMDWFEQHPSQQVSVLMYALVRDVCGEQGGG